MRIARKPDNSPPRLARHGLRLALLAIAIAGPGAARFSQPAGYDMIIRNGRVLDGTGNPFVYADVGIAGDTIAAVGNLKTAAATRVVDARGQYVTPGFIALHEHIEGDVIAGRGALANFTTQGFTTAVIDADGRTRWPLAAQRADLEKAGSALNLVPMVGHGTVRGLAMGDDFMRAATPADIDRMTQL